MALDDGQASQTEDLAAWPSVGVGAWRPRAAELGSERP